MQNGSSWYSSPVWIPVDSCIQRGICAEIIGCRAAHSFCFNHSHGHCHRSSYDSRCSTSSSRPAIGNPQVDPIEHKPAALEHVSPGDQYLLGNLSYWPCHNRSFLGERFIRYRAVFVVLISLDCLAPHGEKKRLIAQGMDLRTLWLKQSFS